MNLFPDCFPLRPEVLEGLVITLAFLILETVLQTLPVLQCTHIPINGMEAEKARPAAKLQQLSGDTAHRFPPMITRLTGRRHRAAVRVYVKIRPQIRKYGFY